MKYLLYIPALLLVIFVIVPLLGGTEGIRRSLFPGVYDDQIDLEVQVFADHLTVNGKPYSGSVRNAVASFAKENGRRISLSGDSAVLDATGSDLFQIAKEGRLRYLVTEQFQ